MHTDAHRNLHPATCLIPTFSHSYHKYSETQPPAQNQPTHPLTPLSFVRGNHKTQLIHIHSTRDHLFGDNPDCIQPTTHETDQKLPSYPTSEERAFQDTWSSQSSSIDRCHGDRMGWTQKPTHFRLHTYGKIVCAHKHTFPQ